jgi:hypothetical protein
MTARLLVALAVLAATSAAAQINSPPPTLMGQPSYHLYSVPGVIHINSLKTFFACTNTTSANIRVGVELFDAVGNSANFPSPTSLDLLPGGTRMFGTGPVTGFIVDSIVGGVFGTGSARILATESKGVICSAFISDDTNSAPASMVSLTVVKKTKQKGD